jgi:hypothetical protein
MPAIEYGTYYWGVILQASGAQGVGETVHLHADQMRVDANGALIFTSAGRRPAGMKTKTRRNATRRAPHNTPPNRTRKTRRKKRRITKKVAPKTQ